MEAPPAAIYRAWTRQFDRWFAVPGTVSMRPVVGLPFHFETEFEGQRHPHYGTFLVLRPDRYVRVTWLTAATRGRETVVTVQIEPVGDGSRVALKHEGFPDQTSLRRHRAAWPKVLARLDAVLQRRSR